MIFYMNDEKFISFIILGVSWFWFFVREIVHYYETKYLNEFGEEMLRQNIEVLKILQDAGIIFPAEAMNDEK